MTDTVSTVLSLQILLGIPIRVKDDDCVGGREIDPQASSPRTQQEKLEFLIGIELFDLLLSFILRHSAINTTAIPSMDLCSPILDDVQHCRKLREDQDLVVVGEESRD